MSAVRISHSAPAIGEEDVAAVLAQLRSGLLAAGAAARRFEARLGATVGAPAGSVLATASGTQALEVALRVAGVGAGDAVVVPTYTCRALADAVGRSGATVALADVGENCALTPETAAAALDGRAAAAVIVVHPFGRRVALEPFRRLGGAVIEDCAHTILPASEADVSVYSFQATKVLTTGEGGAVAARTPAAAAALEVLRQGRDEGGVVAPGFTPLSDLAASLGLAQLDRLAEFAARRRELAAVYDELLGDALEVPANGDVPYRWIAYCDVPFAALRAAMEERGVAIRRPVDPLLHHELGLDGAAFPTAERLYGRIVSLPLYPALSPADARWVAEQLLAVLG